MNEEHEAFGRKNGQRLLNEWGSDWLLDFVASPARGCPVNLVCPRRLAANVAQHWDLAANLEHTLVARKLCISEERTNAIMVVMKGSMKEPDC